MKKTRFFSEYPRTNDAILAVVIANISLTKPLFPNCSSCQTVKNCRIHNSKQRFKCVKCDRQFVEHPHL
ncbi:MULTISPECIES: IS1/IS1595 family N-terminal zinc-binding domain-containing protein [unclassified Microcoleus]|uniref:IS1/IS1595 family N-terminal zinc-binding domain-containing protein n=1 Tax=unclassified Microcoleus TaxID=2642155 RepID=UPI004040B004